MHTETPFRQHNNEIYTNDLLFVAEARDIPNASFIVTACNNHYQLLEALKRNHEMLLVCYGSLMSTGTEEILTDLRTEMKNTLEAIKNSEGK